MGAREIDFLYAHGVVYLSYDTYRQCTKHT